MSNSDESAVALLDAAAGAPHDPVAAVASVKVAVARDRALDMLRGWAIVMMLLSHIGSRTTISAIVHLPIWVSAAEPFVALAGVVLGMRAHAISRAGLVPRTVRLWQIHCTMMLGVVLIHEATGKLRVPSVADAGGWLSVAWKIPTLRLQALDFMNILPLFIVFFAASPALLSAMDRGKTKWILVASAAVWAITQGYPGWFRFTDPACGGEVFVLPAWQLWYVLGLSVGYHRPRLAVFWSRHRAAFLGFSFAITGALFVVAQLQRSHFQKFGAQIPADWWWLTAKETAGPVRVVYDSGLMLLEYLGLAWVLRALPRVATAVMPLETLGSRSLYCFLVHLPLALLASATAFDMWQGRFQEMGAACAILIVYGMAKYGVLKRYIPS